MSPRFSLSDAFLRTQTDQRLAAVVAEGHQLAFATLVERHRAALLGTAGRLVLHQGRHPLLPGGQGRPPRSRPVAGRTARGPERGGGLGSARSHRGAGR